LLALCVVLGAALRLPGIGRSLGPDELFTIGVFTTHSILDIIARYDLPNNHIFHTLCVRAMQGLLGDSEWSLRLPALLAGLAGIPVLFWFARRLTGAPSVGLLSALLLAAHPLHISLSQQSRGYTLLVLCAILYAGFLWLGVTRSLTRHTGTAPGVWTVRSNPHNDTWIWFGVALSGSLATLTLPSAALLIGAGTIGALLLARSAKAGSSPGESSGKGQSRFIVLLPLALATLVIAVHTALVYLPLAEELRAHADRFGQPLTISGFSDFLAATWLAIGPPRLAWLMHLFAAWGLITLEGARRGAGLFLGAIVGLPLVLTLALGAHAEPRLYLFLVPFSLVAIAAGAESLRLLIQRKTAGAIRWTAALPILAVGAAFYSNVSAPIETGYRDAGRYVAEQTRAGDLVIIPYIMDAAIGFYAAGATVDRVRAIPETGIHRVLFVDRPDTDHFRLDDLMLAANFTTDAADHRDTYAHLQLPTAAFTAIRHFGSTVVHATRTSATPIDLGILNQADAWHLYYAQDPAATSITATAASALRLDAGGKAAVIHSRRRVSFTQNGLALIALHKRGNGYASLYEIVDDEPQALQMVTPLAAPAIHIVEGDTVHADVALAPVVANREYGLFLTTHGRVEVSDWRVSFLPYKEPNQ
jgi:hypothetical protein